MVKVGIIADDYTGSADTGVQFAKKSLRTSILRDVSRIREVLNRVDVIVIDTESRLDSKEIAYDKVVAVSKMFKAQSINCVYKKVDSTLRGNLGAELDALLDTFDISPVIFCPAYPKNGRITVGGFHLVHQTLLENTEIAHDPEFPVKESHIPTLLQYQSKHHVSLIDLSLVSQGPTTLLTEIKRQIESGVDIIVVDAVTQDDLQDLAEAIATLDQTVIMCGSGGLAEELPEALGLIPHKARNILVIAGTFRSVTAQQIIEAEATLNAQIIDIDMKEVFLEKQKKKQEISRVIETVQTAFHEGREVIIRWAASPTAAAQVMECGRRLGLDDDRIRKYIGDALGEVAAGIIDRNEVDGMMLTGGETAFNVYRVLEVSEVQVEEEVLPGIPVGQIIDGKGNRIKVITKAGAFGDKNAIVRAIEYLRRGQ